MTFGIFQEAYHEQNIFRGPKSATGVVGTTLNGVMYLSMPLLSTILDSGRWAKWRRFVAVAGVLVSSLAFLLSSWSTEVWHLILSQGILAGLGGAMLFSPTTLFLDEWFKDGNRATAYGASLSSKNVVGTGTPFLMYALLAKVGFRNTLRVWAGVVLVTGLFGIFILPRRSTEVTSRRPRKVPWTFLRHRTFYIYTIGNAIFSSGYGLPQTYLSQYGRTELHLSSILSSLLIVLFNAPGVCSGVGFGLLSDKSGLDASAITQISTLGSTLCVFLLWGLTSNRTPGMLIAFSIGYGFFAGGYSSTWGGWLTELERQAAQKNEAINTGMIYGLMNGARGVGYVAGGLVGVELLKAGGVVNTARWAYGSQYGALIVFTGVCSVLGGWASVWREWSRAVNKWRCYRSQQEL